MPLDSGNEAPEQISAILVKVLADVERLRKEVSPEMHSLKYQLKEAELLCMQAESVLTSLSVYPERADFLEDARILARRAEYSVAFVQRVLPRAEEWEQIVEKAFVG